MRNRRRLLVSTSVLVIMIGAIFYAGKSYAQEEAPLSKQDAPFKTYTLDVYCGSPQFPTAGFFYEVPEKAMGNKEICAGKCGGRTVSLADALAQLPGAVATAFRRQVTQHIADAAAGKGASLACALGDTKPPPEDKKQDCREKFLCCNNTPERGFFYVGTKANRIYSEPSTSSTLVESLPSGTRVRYTSTTQVNEQIWY